MGRLHVQIPKPIPLENVVTQNPIKVVHFFIIYYTLYKMNNQINIIVQNQVFLLNRDLLISESENKQIKISKDFTLPFPEWVTKQIYLLIQKYLKTKDVSFLKAYINENDTIVKVLRTADYLGMIKFNDKYINQILIPNINHLNCLTLLEESHKKLKNINDSQTWYNLLNMSIIYLSTHAYEVFKLNAVRFKKLNEKIINQILERVIRLERKLNFPNKHMLYQLIMECKETQIGDISRLFDNLRANLKAKKIHSKIHAKLSWKLQNVPELSQKSTKNFKYLDMNWFLKAHKEEQGLLVTLNLLPFEQINFRSSQSDMSETQKSQNSVKSFKAYNKSADQRKQSQQVYRNDTFTKIGVFYSKVQWKYQEQSYQQDIDIHYVLMNQCNAMDIILIDKKMEKIIDTERVELTIYCNTEAIYTFLLNYVFWHYGNLKFKGKDFCKEELAIMIKVCKKVGNFSEALRIIAQLFNAYPNQTKNAQTYQGFDFSKMTKVELEIYNSIFGKKLMAEPFTKIKNIEIQKSTPVQSRISQTISQQLNNSNITQKRTISPIPITPINSINKKATFSSSSSQLNANNPIIIASTPGPNANFREKLGSFNRTNSGRQNNIANIESLANSRRDSRGSKRKIFSKYENEQNERRNDLMEEMMRVTDLSLYLNPEPMLNPEYHKLSMILKL